LIEGWQASAGVRLDDDELRVTAAGDAPIPKTIFCSDPVVLDVGVQQIPILVPPQEAFRLWIGRFGRERRSRSRLSKREKQCDSETSAPGRYGHRVLKAARPSRDEP
jgi:hypothetical protein